MTSATNRKIDSYLLDETEVYGLGFWYAYLANTALVVAHSLMFRYADFVTYLGGTEFELGWIVGAGMFGSLAMRLLQGVGIDHYGARRIWLWSLALYVLSLLLHLFIGRIDSWPIYAARILLSTSVAGAFGCSITCVSRSVPTHRMAEVIGNLGSSGFVGMMIGPSLGDLLCGSGAVDMSDLHHLFLAAAGLAAISWLAAWKTTTGEVRPNTNRHIPLLWQVRRYHPGAVLLAAAALGIGVGLPQTFLRTFVASLGINEIGLFFLVYAPTAFVVRLLIRRLPEIWGNRPLIIIGFGFMSLGVLSFLVVDRLSLLALPAVVMGTAHAILFPTVIAEGSAAFPIRYRGVGTTLVLAMIDLGVLVGAPLAGIIVRYSPLLSLPSYPTMFSVIAGLLVICTIIYAIQGRPNDLSQNGRSNSRRRAMRPRRSTSTVNGITLNGEKSGIGATSRSSDQKFIAGRR